MSEARISTIGKALGDPNRARILTLLVTGKPHTAGELAASVGLAASTTSRHLSILVDAGLVRADAAGRYRYFTVTSPDVALLLSHIDTMALPREPVSRAPGPVPIAVARTCYDHLAGELAVQIFQAMTTTGLIEQPDGGGPRLTGQGHAKLRALGIDTEQLGGQPRPLIRPCLDWQRQTHHLGGAAGAALLDTMVDNRWVVRRSDQRAVEVTDLGARRLRAHFALRM